jgi:hypothetical protein
MGLIKKVFDSDGSKVVVLPKLWIKYIEKKSGKPLKHVTIDIAEDEVKIKPFLEE